VSDTSFFPVKKKKKKHQTNTKEKNACIGTEATPSLNNTGK
jgi:hypothetical protein